MDMREEFRWGACDETDTQLWSRLYDDFDECYEDYVQAMTALCDIGTNLALYKWRGVFNLEQTALLVADRNLYVDELHIKEAD